jgi:hypothetical protein
MNTNRSKQKRKDGTKKEPVHLRERIDRSFSKWERFRSNWALIITLIAVALFLAARSYYDGNDKTVQLKFVENPAAQSTDSGPSAVEPSKQVLSGEPYETALRLRESGALLMAVSLSSFEDFRTRGKLPATMSEILVQLQKRSLLPPGVEIKNETLRSALSDLKLNYRPEPFSFEIFSVSIGKHNGPALLFRFPMPPVEANSIMYFQFSPNAAPITLRQFSTPEQLVAAGWSISHWRGEAFPLDDAAVQELREQDAWLKSLDQGGK